MRHLLWMIKASHGRFPAFCKFATGPMFPFDSKVLAPSRGIMHIDHFASHHGCWLGWYSGWSNSRQRVGQRSRQQCSFLGCKRAARNQRHVALEGSKLHFKKSAQWRWLSPPRACLATSVIHSLKLRSHPPLEQGVILAEAIQRMIRPLPWSLACAPI